MRKFIDDYYAFRKYVDPTRLQAILWLLAETGELVRAYRETLGQHDSITPSERSVLQMASMAGKMAESAVDNQAIWVRNNDRENPPDVGDEIGDVFMMLDRFAKMAGEPDPAECFIRKSVKKGYEKG